MKKVIVIGVIGFVMSAALAACGGKGKTPSTTPDNKGGATEMKTGGTGGATYGNAKGGAVAPAPAGAASDPCSGGQ